MPELPILKPEEIRKPKVLFKLESGITETDWDTSQELLGGVETREKINPSRDYKPYITEFEYQRQTVPGLVFDEYSCVPNTKHNGQQVIAKLKYGVVLNNSKRASALLGGCKPRRGSNVQTIFEVSRNPGQIAEELFPTMTPTMTEDKWYDKTGLDELVKNNENFISQGWKFNHEWLERASAMAENSLPIQVYNNLPFSPIAGAVDGDYRFSERGFLAYGRPQGYVGPFIEYNHYVLIVNAVLKADGSVDYFEVLDTENPQGIMRVEGEYKFGHAKLMYLKKNSMFRLAKTASSPAVFLLCEASMRRLGIADSPEVDLTGGQMLKTMSGTYGNAGIQTISGEEMAKYDFQYVIKATLKS
jgi:hypothetical protein